MVNELFDSTLSFLRAYAANHEKRSLRIQAIDNRIKELSPAVDESANLELERKSLLQLNKDEEKFLLGINTAFLVNTGEPISNGPLFTQAEKN
jgi:hypothetical protein